MLTVSLDKKRNVLYTGSQDDTIKLWELDTYECIGTLEGHARSVHCTLLGNRADIFSSSSSSSSCDPSSSSSSKVQEEDEDEKEKDQDLLFSCGMDNAIRVWDVTDISDVKCLALIEDFPGTVFSISLIGHNLYGGCQDTSILVIDLREVLEPHTENEKKTRKEKRKGKHKKGNLPPPSPSPTPPSSPSPPSLSPSPLKRYSAKDMITRHLKGHIGFVYTLTHDEERNYLFSGSGDATVKVWNPTTGMCTQSFVGHVDNITSIAPHGDRTLFSGSRDG